jgi:hypothetical protein
MLSNLLKQWWTYHVDLQSFQCPRKSQEIPIRGTHNPLVVGSSPTRPTNEKWVILEVRLFSNRKLVAMFELRELACPTGAVQG